MTQWSRWKRIAFRFVFVYIVLYLLPFPLDGIPKLDVAATYYTDLWIQAVPWFGRNILHLPYEITEFPGDSGDTTFNYVQLLCFLTISVAVAGLWTIIDRKRPSYPRLLDWLRIYVRFSLGLTMFGYGIAKVINTQFRYPDLDRYIQPIGHASPMGLLWTFMGFSNAYCVFTGLAECIGGFLLLWRRTTTAGALIVAGVMLNVVMLNFCYDVPVKLFSTHLVLLSFFLLAPDGRRMIEFFFLNRPTTAAPLGTPFASRRLNRLALIIKLLFVGWSTVPAATSAWERKGKYSIDAPLPPLYGLYEVESFTRSGEPALSSPGEEKRWRRAVFNRYGSLSVQFMDDSLQRFIVNDNVGDGKLELTPRWEPDRKSTLAYRKQDANQLVIEGDFFGDNLQIVLHRVLDPQFLLVNRGFHWINEKPYNR